jgi:hypothetical protein
MESCRLSRGERTSRLSNRNLKPRPNKPGLFCRQSLNYRAAEIGTIIMFRGLIDFLTLVLILAAGLQLGLQGFFGWDAVGLLFGAHERISAVWQIFRQRIT